VQHGGGVGGIADHHQVGVGGHPGRVESEVLGRVEQHPLHGVAGGPQRGLRLGELRVHHHRPAGVAQRPGEQHEALGRAGGEEYLFRGSPVPVSDGGPGRAGVRVRGQPAQGGDHRIGQPVGHRGAADVDRQVDQAGGDLDVPVVPEVGLVRRGLGELSAHVRDPAGKPPPGTADPGVGRVTTAPPARPFMNSSHF
jgi:hypothetical protein